LEEESLESQESLENLESLEPEVVEEPRRLPIEIDKPEPPKRKLRPVEIKIAEMAARGWTPEEIAKEVHRSRERVYLILKTEEVWDYMKGIIRDTFSEGDRILVLLYKKAMKGLDDDLQSSDPDVRKVARDQVLKTVLSKIGALTEGEKTQVNLFQFMGGGKEGSGQSLIQSMDDIILQKRKERGLSLNDEDDEETMPV